MQKIFPVRRFRRFYHYRFERRQFVLAPSAAMYIRSFLRRLRHKNSQSDKWISSPPFFNGIKGSPSITWIGHSTFLIQVGGKTILTDPIFGDATFLFKRAVSSPIMIDDLPHIDYILISHNHRDHMDEVSIRALKERFSDVKILVPYGDKKWFDARFISHVDEFFWWETFNGDDVSFTFLPAHHWSGRGFYDRNQSLWGSWMIEVGGLTIYFAGDTGYWKHFSCIRHYFPSIDVALMPIGPCEPLEYMRKSHLNADFAVRAFLELGARLLIPMHWGTFYFGTDQFLTPITYLREAWNKRASLLEDKMLQILKFGEVILLPNLFTENASVTSSLEL